ncbi:hypothetical protein BH11ARM2_BH11ARM2_27370 [soil metagenome]
MAQALLTGEEVVARGKEIYDRINPELEKEHYGEYLAINALTAEWAMHPRSLADAREALPHPPAEGVVYGVRVGWGVLGRFHGGRKRGP